MKKYRDYYQILRNRANCDYLVDEQTALDLDLDAVFGKINHTLSPIGTQYLCARLLIHDLTISEAEQIKTTARTLALQKDLQQKVKAAYEE